MMKIRDTWMLSTTHLLVSVSISHLQANWGKGSPLHENTRIVH